ncbi:hypothetical protein [Sutcliffiella rhizosphaerae]|uniref:Lipoprotein n=1 Tax=Sutcliffiella rhizosphaerae TaxID=2880967 RepID=A0ABN8AKY0_9BACI|nr:hypothetical protein [Sutcliffiella rhizosphaerae]CAG9623560.1 hypothetical protein BACCIP111883_04378 [Sutcliffiella rhizosphaerae]
MKKLILVLSVITLLAACSADASINFRYMFAGNSDNWEAEYIESGKKVFENINGKNTYSSESADEFILKYIGNEDELKSVKKVEYSYKTSAGGGSEIRNFDKAPNKSDLIFKSDGSSVNGANVSGNENIQVIVKWDGKEETFELKKGEN